MEAGEGAKTGHLGQSDRSDDDDGPRYLIVLETWLMQYALVPVAVLFQHHSDPGQLQTPLHTPAQVLLQA